MKYTNMITKFKIFENINNFNDNFWKWFGKSQVVDETGNPLICYHGTSKNFKMFNPKMATMGGIFWFSSDKDKIKKGESGANGYTKIMEVYLSAKNLAGWTEYEPYGLGEIERMGFDGIKLDDDYIIFNNNQIKSINNDGSWDIDDKNIYS